MKRPDAAGYVLGELDAARASAFERAMAEDPAQREEAEGLRAVARRLERLPAEAWHPVDPPPLVDPSAPPPRTAARGRLVLRPAVAALAAAALLAGGAALGALLGPRDEAPRPAPVAGEALPLRPLGEGGAAARGQVVVTDGGRAAVRVSGLPPASRGEFYELWLLGDDGLVALGSFQVGRDGAARLEVPLPVDPARYEAFDVSVEPGDGDPAHSGRSVLRGPAARS